MHTKYANIVIKGEKQIGVIDFGDVSKIKQKDVERFLRNTAEPKLVEALQSHFDCQVTIILSKVKSHTPIELEVDVIIKSIEEDYQEVVTLEETWLY